MLNILAATTYNKIKLYIESGKFIYNTIYVEILVTFTANSFKDLETADERATARKAFG